jgi:hypothetical protein
LLNFVGNWSADKEKSLDTEQEAGWAQEPFWALRFLDIPVPLPRNETCPSGDAPGKIILLYLQMFQRSLAPVLTL